MTPASHLITLFSSFHSVCDECSVPLYQQPLHLAQQPSLGITTAQSSVCTQSSPPLRHSTKPFLQIQRKQLLQSCSSLASCNLTGSPSLEHGARCPLITAEVASATEIIAAAVSSTMAAVVRIVYRPRMVSATRGADDLSSTRLASHSHATPPVRNTLKLKSLSLRHRQKIK